MNKVVVYWETNNPCCYESGDKYKSHEVLLKEKPKIITLWLVDEDKLKDCWGDDWNDAPACCNSGTPYTGGKYPEITKMEIKLGETIKG